MENRSKYYAKIMSKIRNAQGEDYYAESEGLTNYIIGLEEQKESLESMFCQVQYKLLEFVRTTKVFLDNSGWNISHKYWCKSLERPRRKCDCGLDEILVDLRELANANSFTED